MKDETPFRYANGDLRTQLVESCRQLRNQLVHSLKKNELLNENEYIIIRACYKLKILGVSLVSSNLF